VCAKASGATRQRTDFPNGPVLSALESALTSVPDPVSRRRSPPPNHSLQRTRLRSPLNSISLGARLNDPDQTLEAARGIRVVARYLLIVGAFGLFIEFRSGLACVAGGAAALTLAWLVASYQSRVAALICLVAAASLLGVSVRGILQAPHWPNQGSDVTGLLLLIAWLAVGVYALISTVRFHASASGS
jgi:hypothetical protein